MKNPPRFDKTKQDLQLEKRDIQIEINKVNTELEIIQRSRDELNNWAESKGRAAQEFLGAIRGEIRKEYGEFDRIDIKNREKRYSAINEQVEHSEKAFEKSEAQVRVSVKKKSDLNKQIISLKARKEDEESSLNAFLEESNKERGVLKIEKKELTQEVNALNVVLEQGTKELDEKKKYNNGWSDYLHGKERDLRLWEIRVARKLKKEFPHITLQFKEWDGKVRTITAKP